MQKEMEGWERGRKGERGERGKIEKYGRKGGWIEEKMISKIVAKASDGQRYPLPLSKGILGCESERGSGLEGR